MKDDGVASQRASILQRDGPVLALVFALTLIMTNPLALHLADAVEDKQDALLNTWIIAWVGHALTTDPLHLFDANIFYPYRNTLAFSEVLLPQGLLALPIHLASGDTILGYNLVLLFSFLLAAYAMYLLVFDLTRQRIAGIVAGVVFAFNPYNLGNLAQVQLLSFGWMPLGLLALRRVTSNAQGATRNAILFGLFFSLQTLASIYYGFLAGVAVVLYIAWSIVTNHVLHIKYFVSLLTRLSISAVVIAVLVVPLLVPYLQVQRELGFERNIEESEQFSASLKLFTEVSARNVVYGPFLSPRPPIVAGGYPQDNLFPGLVPVLLGIAGVIASKSRERWFYICLLVIAFVLALGPRLFLTPTIGTSIALPYRWLYDTIPLVHALRAPVRFDALVMLALAALAGMGVGAVGRGQEAAGSRRKAEALLLPFAFCVLICLEYFAFPAANTVPVPVGYAVPDYVRWLAQQPKATILELPMTGSDCGCSLDLTFQYFSSYHWHSTPDGYSGFNPKPRGGIAYEMQFLPSERSVSLLQALDVEYIILHSTRYQDWDARRVEIDRAADLRFVQQFGKDYIYRVAPRATNVRSLNASVYLPSPAAPGQHYTGYLIVKNPGPRSVAIKPTEALQIDAQWSDGTRQHFTASMPLVTSRVSVVPLQLVSPSHIGTYRVHLHVQGNWIEAWDLSAEVAVSDEEPARQVVLPARVSLDSPLRAVYAAGATIDVGVTWHALNKINDYYSVSVRVVDAQGVKKSDAGDREPAEKTMLWVPGSEIPDRFSITVPPDLAPGEYSVRLLMYQANLGLEALLLDENYAPRETIELGRFTVR